MEEQVRWRSIYTNACALRWNAGMSHDDCLFCKILAHQVDAQIEYEDDDVLAFHDINPQAPHHLLIIPRQHIDTLNSISPENADCIANMFALVPNLAKKLGIAEEGYRTVFNCNAHGGQTVYHIHLHLLGGRQMLWPPG